jgi:hypothetical protein
MFGLDFSGARKFLQTQNASRLMRLELSCARFILVEVSLHEKILLALAAALGLCVGQPAHAGVGFGIPLPFPFLVWTPSGHCGHGNHGSCGPRGQEVPQHGSLSKGS